MSGLSNPFSLLSSKKVHFAEAILTCTKAFPSSSFVFSRAIE